MLYLTLKQFLNKQNDCEVHKQSREAGTLPLIKMYHVKKIICAVKISTLEAELIEGFEIDGASVKIPIVGGKSSLWCL